ncbi:undecaprenyl-diphosphate phosphatase [Thermoproteus uzoniensis]|nr:undecaprenyl-diphosphate phosphatase [Thermoproteus uzoniensis]
MNWAVDGAVLGLVQGVSEWLPISSKTQIMFVSTYLLGLTFGAAYAFGLFLEFATLAAAVIYFRREVWGVLKALALRGSAEDKMLLKYLVVVTLVTAAVAAPIYLYFSSVSGPVVGLPMIALGLVLIADGLLIRAARERHVPSRGLADLRMRDLVLIGVAQGLAAFPGVSRSGITVSAMLLMGVRPRDAFRLSFLALIPAALGASVLPLLASRHEVLAAVSLVSPQGLALAAVVATAASLLLIEALLRLASSRRIVPLVIGLGAVAIAGGTLGVLAGYG